MDRTTPTSIPVSHAGTRAHEVRREWDTPRPRQPMPAPEPPKPEPVATAPERPRVKVINVKPEPVVKTVYRDRPLTGRPSQAEIDRVLDHVFGEETK